jgi:uroporphyrinogen-III decarboxylase
MGFEGALLAMFEEPDEVIALLTHISEFYTLVLKKQMYYLKPEIYILMDDDSAYRAPFFSLEMYRKIFKPFHKLHADIAQESGALVDRHDCGKSEQFIDDWLEIGVKGWSPVQNTNDCKAIKKKYVGRLALAGCWDPTIVYPNDEALKDAIAEYVDTFAPGGGFTFSVMMGGDFNDPEVQRKNDLVRQFFFDYARDFYAKN